MTIQTRNWVYRAGWYLLRWLGQRVFQLEAYGTEQVPLTGRLIVTANHLSYLDPPIIGCMCPRELRYLAKAELFQWAPFARLIRRVGATPVERGTADVSAIKTVLRLLDEAQAVLIFIEGTRGDGRALLPPTAGVTLLARQSDAPVLPTAIIGTDKAWGRGMALPRPAKVIVAFGEPVCYRTLYGDRTDRTARNAFSDYIMEQIAGLWRMLGYPIALRKVE